MPGSEPAHPVLNGNDDILIGIDLTDPPRGPIAGDDCDGKNRGRPQGVTRTTRGLASVEGPPGGWLEREPPPDHYNDDRRGKALHLPRPSGGT